MHREAMGNGLDYENVSLDKLSHVADQILSQCLASRLFLLRGNLGAGKTTLVREFAAILGYHGEVSSPTFSIINEYATAGDVFYHMDLYRLESDQEAIDIGIIEYLDSGKYCFIEWPEVAMRLIDPPYYQLSLEAVAPDERHIYVQLIQE
jgi:tRNA threonylcarbamoyladenosine biosynthesis protein TsaE